MHFYEGEMKNMNDLIASPSEENINLLKKYLLEKDSGTYEKHLFPNYAARLFLFLGVEGVRKGTQ
ncbi:hypothetical protein [Cohnella phaseoli]|uniref:hypothetical protein n=1 Tax=Cohnella phaseoli TaxID=456490 RepID=UPI001C6E63A3|nr:hypothetical protein [Cohnella phaseoli]